MVTIFMYHLVYFSAYFFKLIGVLTKIKSFQMKLVSKLQSVAIIKIKLKINKLIELSSNKILLSKISQLKPVLKQKGRSASVREIGNIFGN